MAFVSKQSVETSKGKAWRVRWRDPEGRSREEWVYGSRRTAERRAKALETDLHRGQYVDDRRGSKTFREVAEEWLDTRTKARPVTITKYRLILERWIYPEFGSRRVATIRTEHIGRFVNRLKTEPCRGTRSGTLRPSTIRRIFQPLNAVLRYAVDEEYLRVNPARRIELPDEASMGVETFEGTALSWSIVKKVADSAAEIHPMYGLVVRFLARTGLRGAELSGLRVGDHREGWISVERTITRDRNEPDGLREGKPKSRNSRRSVPLGPDIDAEIREYLACHPSRSDPAAPLFPNRVAGGEHDLSIRRSDPFDWSRPINPDTFRSRVFVPACVRAGIPRVRLHDLRVTYGSLMLAAGIDLWHVSRYLGHSSPDLTAKVYAKLLTGSATQDAARMAAYCEGTDDGTVTTFRRNAV